MDEKRTKAAGPDHASRMEKAEGSRETVMNSESRDLGTSSDRAMFQDESSDRLGSRPRSPNSSSRERGSGASDMRGRGSAGERNSSDSGGISNRERSQEESEQDRLPERGRSQAER
jgi:hypothetical protein